MRNEFVDEIGDTLFAVAMAAAIGFGAANLGVQVNKQRAAFDAAAASQKLDQPAHPSPDAAITDADKTLPAGLNF
jgi:hypothetical protein